SQHSLYMLMFPSGMSISFQLFFPIHLHMHDRPSFPTRRSSDLVPRRLQRGRRLGEQAWAGREHREAEPAEADPDPAVAPRRRPRSEEHTSELQSRFDIVCRLLLEKKKNKLF